MHGTAERWEFPKPPRQLHPGPQTASGSAAEVSHAQDCFKSSTEGVVDIMDIATKLCASLSLLALQQEDSSARGLPAASPVRC